MFQYVFIFQSYSKMQEFVYTPVEILINCTAFGHRLLHSLRPGVTFDHEIGVINLPPP